MNIKNILKLFKTKKVCAAFAEVYFTKKLRATIHSLRKHDDLNEEALDRLIGYINKKNSLIFFYCTIFTLPFFFVQNNTFSLVFVTIMNLALIASALYDVKEEINKFVPLYNCGNFTQGSYDYCHVGGGIYTPRQFIIKIKFKIDGYERVSSLHRKNAPTVLKYVEQGTPTLVVYDAMNFDKNLPFIEPYISLFYLRKTLPHEKHHQ